MAPQASEPLHAVNQRWASGGVTRIRIDVPLSVPAHGHAHPHLCVITQGAFDERWTPTAYCARGTLRWSPATDVHELRIREAPFECIVIGVTDSTRVPAPETRVYGQSDAILKAAQALSIAMNDNDPLAMLSVRGMTAELVAAGVRHGTQGDLRDVPEWLTDARRRIDREFRQPVVLRTLARWADVHPVHVSRAFRSHYGRTMREYVRERRLIAAVQSLRSTNESISCIAAECGFSDHAHLTRVMRQWLGFTPRTLRE